VRPVSRGADPPPEALAAGGIGPAELLRARLHQQDTNPNKGSFAFAAYKNDEVKRRLEALFHGKCAYCETPYSASAPVDIEHYRPKGAVAEDPAHPGYWWLAMAWENLLPSCIDCNRKRKQVLPQVGDSLEELRNRARAGDATLVNVGKKDSFPIASGGARGLPEQTALTAEQALLLDPCAPEPADQPEAHLAFHLDEEVPVALVLPRGDPPSPRGLASIQVYGLNRLGLVQERTRLLRHLEFLGEVAVELGAMAEEIEANVPSIAQRLRFLQDRMLAEMAGFAKPEAPYSALAAAWLRRFRERLDSI
jgi:hypothetical protein